MNGMRNLGCGISRIRKTRHVLLFILTSAVWLFPGLAGAHAHEFQSIGIQRLDGGTAPDFALPGLNGKTIRLSEFRGKVVFLNFWASWCPACRVEMPAMEALHRRFKDHDFILLAVAMDTGGRKPVQSFMKKLGLSFPILLDPENRVSDQYRVNLIPTTFIIGRRGELLGKTVGPKAWDGPASARLFDRLVMEVKTPSSTGRNPASQ